ncbi:transglycosylase domain-containing protein [Streptomyces sp. NPDC057638]|uniref:transglycosylase domain-containing protein n=1 Tax=Streptomyces sp. NPDC057638 TaxID=3346190 RepID=UPI003698329E
MSEHRRKPPQAASGGRAAARRAAQQSSGRRAAPLHGAAAESPSDSDPHGEERPYGGRAEARRAAQRGSRRRVDSGGGGGGRGGGRRGTGGGGGHDGPGGPGKKRFIDYPRFGKHGWRRWLPSWRLTTSLCFGFLGTMMIGAFTAYAMVEVPDPQKAAEAQNNVYYWADGSQMVATGGETNRQIISIGQIPNHMEQAVVSAENKTFWKDSGVDPRGILRAALKMAQGGNTQGGSTITQQYVKNAHLGDQSQTFSRKFKELFISIKVGADMDKEEIMAGYLNTSFYGRNAYGIQAAARAYYDVDAEKLTPSQSAFLAAVLKGATYYDPAGSVENDPAATPAANLKRATERWRWILDEMVKDGGLSGAERDKYVAEGFPTPKPLKKSAQLSGQTGYLVSLAKANFLSKTKLSERELAAGGYQIHTTFKKDLVHKLTKAVDKVRKENIDAKKRPETDTHVQFGGASVDVKTGAIAAVYGGEDATTHFTNNADVTGAQVGSTFKPFVLAAAMRDGVRDPKLGAEQSASERTIIDPDKTIYNGKNKLKIKRYNGEVWQNEEGKEWLQVNDGDQSYKNINLREAMIVSANSPFVQLGMDIGIPQVREAAVDAGLLEKSLDPGNVPSFSIGISTPSAIRMAGSYATFAASGQQRDPYSVTKVLQDGKLIYSHKEQVRGAFPAAVADNVTDILKDVVEDEDGTGKNARIPGREVAGKTGTTDGNKSAWFVGYTPDLATAIDMYRLDDDENNKNRAFLEMFGTGGQEKIHGSSFPSEIWQLYMADAVKGTPVTTFPEPEQIGEAVWGGGASSPPPSPTEKESESATSSPSKEEEEEEKPTKDVDKPSPSNSCKEWEQWSCGPPGSDNGGNPGEPGGGDGKPTNSESSPSDGENGSGDNDGGEGDNGSGSVLGSRG